MRTLVVSDMHIGCGACSNLFTGARAFLELLAYVARRPTRIVLNGDTFDFLAQESAHGVDPAQVMHAFTEDPTIAAVLGAIGDAIARGGELVIRAGEHDRALEAPAVQDHIVRALAGPATSTTRINFHPRSRPTLLDIGGARVVIAHDARDERDGATNRWLAVHLLNPLRRQYGVGPADLLRPDYASAAMAALAVNPTAAKLVLGLTDDDVWRQVAGTAPGPGLRLARLFATAGLSAREREVLICALDPGAVLGASPEDYEVLEQVRLKLLRRSLARQPAPSDDGLRRLVGAEWHAARRLARQFGASAAIVGHSRAVGWRSEDEVTAVDTGTWTWLVDPPAVGSGVDVWRRTLDAWQRTPRLGARPDGVALRTRWTAALIEPRPARRGSRLALVEWRSGGGLAVLRERSLPPV